MSLWHATNQKPNKKRLPELESLPELDSLFEEFEAEFNNEEDKSSTMDNDSKNNEVEIENEVEEIKRPPVEKSTSLEDYKAEENTENFYRETRKGLPTIDEELSIDEEEDNQKESNQEVSRGRGSESSIDETEENQHRENLQETSRDRKSNASPQVSKSVSRAIYEGYEDYEEIEGLEDDVDEEIESSFKKIEDEDVKEVKTDSEGEFSRISKENEEEIENEDLEEEIDDEQELKNKIDLDDDLEEDFGEEEFGLLPGMSIEEPEEESKIVSKPDETKTQQKEPNKKGGFRELDEEKAKAFFKGLFKKKPNKQKQPKKAKGQDKQKKLPKIGIKNEKVKKVLSISLVIIIIAALVFFGYKFLSKPKTPLKESSVEVTLKDKENVILKEFTSDGKKLGFKVENKSEMSKEFFMYMTLDKIDCESNIISVEPGEIIKETASCKKDVDSNDSYDVKVEAEETT